jgi:hypothetical protein
MGDVQYDAAGNSEMTPSWRAATLAMLIGAAPGAASPVHAQGMPSAPADAQVVDASDKTDTGLVQLEFGGTVTRVGTGSDASATPLTVRYGVSDWLEASVGVDGLVRQRDGGVRASGFGNVQAGVKVRAFGSAGGAPVLAVLPQVTLPTADSSQGLGTGQVDVTVGLVSGKDLAHGAHVDLAYGIGAIGAGAHAGRFAQHTATAGLSAALASHWTPVLGVAWVSRQDGVTGAALSLTADSAFAVSQRLAFDVGSQFGVSVEAPSFEVSAGLSLLVGELHPDQQGVRARRHRLLWHPRRRAARRR